MKIDDAIANLKDNKATKVRAQGTFLVTNFNFGQRETKKREFGFVLFLCGF